MSPIGRRMFARMFGVGMASAPAIARAAAGAALSPAVLSDPLAVSAANLVHGPSLGGGISDEAWRAFRRLTGPSNAARNRSVHVDLLGGGFHPDIAALQSISHGHRVRMQMRLIRKRAAESSSIKEKIGRLAGIPTDAIFVDDGGLGQA